jgi:hypothetical protein
MKKLLFPILLLLFLIVAGCDSPEKNGVVELDGPILESIDTDGNFEFNGAVINTSDQPVRSVYVVIVLKDRSGNIIEANSVSLFEEDMNALLYPSERAFFRMSVASDPNRVFSKEVEIYYEDPSEAPPPS